MTEYWDEQFDDDGGEADTPESVAERQCLPRRDQEWDDDSDEFNMEHR